MALPPDERNDREKVNAAVRDGLKRGPLLPAGSADQHGGPMATNKQTQGFYTRGWTGRVFEAAEAKQEAL